jgi:hypothetical protein
MRRKINTPGLISLYTEQDEKISNCENCDGQKIGWIWLG